jgi:hypothetical protein
MWHRNVMNATLSRFVNRIPGAERDTLGQSAGILTRNTLLSDALPLTQGIYISRSKAVLCLTQLHRDSARTCCHA